MRILILVLMLIPFSYAKGQKSEMELPKTVERMLKDRYGKTPVELTEATGIQTPPGDRFLLIHRGTPAEPGGYLHLGRVKTCRASGCSAPGASAPGEESEYFDYAIIFSPAVQVEKVRIYNYQASHGHGIAAAGWLRQFEGVTSESTLEVGKNIDGITGATISVHAITDDIRLKTELLQEAMNDKP